MNVPRRVAPLLVVAAILAVVASCVESRNPVSDEKTSKIDERLIGTWRMGNEEDDGVWKVTKHAKQKNALDVALPENGDEHYHATAFTTTIKSKHYLSLRQSSDDDASTPDAPAGYEIYQYVFDDNNTVQVRGMDPDVILKAIADKKLRGKIVITKTTTRPILGLFGKAEVVEEKSPEITDTPENIVRYIEAHADKCFLAKTDEVETFKRQK